MKMIFDSRYLYELTNSIFTNVMKGESNGESTHIFENQNIRKIACFSFNICIVLLPAVTESDDSPYDSTFIKFLKIEFVSSYKYQESKINFIQ